MNKHRLDCERISQLPGSALLLTGEQSPLILKDSIYVLVTILPNSRVLDGQHQAADIMALEMDADALI